MAENVVPAVGSLSAAPTKGDPRSGRSRLGLPSDVPLCPKCGLHPCIKRKNGRLLPECTQCWATRSPVGTRSTTQHGYMRLKTEHGWRFEHIVVAESVLGRPLRSDEKVTWANGDKQDNDPANLVIGVTRFRPLVEAPKRPKDRTGEKHKPRVELRIDPRIRAIADRKAAELGAKVPRLLANLAESGVLLLLSEAEREAYYLEVVRDFEEGRR